MKDVTYLFGAGASANALPTWKNFKDRLIGFREFLKYDRSNNNGKMKVGRIIKNETLNETLNSIIAELDWHSTPDTIAKKYFHQNKNVDILKLKAALICFFMFEQSADSILKFNSEKGNFSFELKKTMDMRYDVLIASILKNIRTAQLKKNYSVLTWNYDYQFELTFGRYSIWDLSKNHNYLNVWPSWSNYDSELANSEFSIHHINGLAYIYDDEFSQLYNGPFELNKYPVEVLFRLFNSLIQTEIGSKRIDEFFHFSWESIETCRIAENFIESHSGLSRIANRTNILVVVGYSFPIFNREIDLAIFERMTKIEQVVIQSFEPENIIAILSNFYKKIYGKPVSEGFFKIEPPEQGFYVPFI